MDPLTLIGVALASPAVVARGTPGDTTSASPSRLRHFVPSASRLRAGVGDNLRHSARRRMTSAR